MDLQVNGEGGVALRIYYYYYYSHGFTLVYNKKFEINKYVQETL